MNIFPRGETATLCALAKVDKLSVLPPQKGGTVCLFVVVLPAHVCMLGKQTKCTSVKEDTLCQIGVTSKNNHRLNFSHSLRPSPTVGSVYIEDDEVTKN